MKSSNPYSLHPKHLQNAKALRRARTQEAPETPTPPPTASTLRTVGREYVNPVDYQHPFDSMARVAKMLAVRFDARCAANTASGDRPSMASPPCGWEW